MVAIMNSNVSVGDIREGSVVSENLVESLSEQLQLESAIDSEQHLSPGDEKSDRAVVRSVAMSANVAHTVKSEVNHLIRVDSFNEYLDQLTKENIPNTQPLTLPSNIPNSVCSHILPSEKENILLGIILSKWDDIMGPQTVHVWLKTENEEVHDEPEVETSKPVNGSKTGDCFHSQNAHLMKAIKYITCHTVNYVSVTPATMVDNNSNIFSEKNSSLFVVPDLNVVAQSLVFQLRARELNVPYSLSFMVPYEQYDYHLHLRRVSQVWIRWLSNQLHRLLLKCIQTNKEFATSKPVDLLMLEFATMLLSLKTCGLGTLSHMRKYPIHILKDPLLERALTSHLQTFGYTVVMGSTADKINDLIAFLALFLETDELFCSRFLLPPFKYSFHKGLYLQGLILDEFGCRELRSEELSANPYPVTTVDLTRGTSAGAVKQSSFKSVAEMSRHQSMLSPVRGSKSNLVQGVIRDLKLLPVDEWKQLAHLFRAKIRALSRTLIDLATETYEHGHGKKNLTVRKHLSRAMNLEDADFLIVLSSAEKMKPGIFSSVLYPAAECT